MVDVAQLQVLVSADTSQAESSLGRFGQSVSQGFGIGAGVAAFTAGMSAISGAFAGSIKAAGDLQQSVANISTIKPEIDTSAVFGALNEMSTRIPQSASELGSALYDVFSSVTVSAEEGLKLTETFAKGAIGASTDAQTFGTAAMGVMNAYGLSVADATHISDVFFNTVAAGVVTGPELAASLGPVTASAKAAGVSLDEMGAMIVGVTKMGGPAAQNINNLNNLLQKITTKEAQAAMQKLGIATTDATGAFRPQIEVLRDLNVSLSGMSESAKAMALQKIFPDAQARQGAQAIMAQLAAVDDALKTNQTATGATEEAYAKMSATFNSQSKLLMNSLTAIGTAIGAELLPYITPLVTAFAQQLPAAFNTAKAAAAPYIQILKDIGTTIQQVFAGDWSPDASIDPFVNAVGMIGIVIRDQVMPALSTLAGAFQTAFGWIQSNLPVILSAVAGIGAALVAIWAGGQFVAGAAAAAAAVTLLLSPIGLLIAASALLGIAWANDWGGIQEKTASFIAWFQDNLPLMQTTAETTWAGIETVMSAHMAAMGSMIRLLGAVMNGDWRTAWAEMTAIADAEGKAQAATTAQNAGMMQQALDTFFNGSGTAFVTWADATGATVAAWAASTTASVATWATDTWTAITTWATNTQTTVTTWGTTLLTAITTAWATITTAIQTALTGIETAFTTSATAIQTIWQAGWALLGTIVTAAWNLITPENQTRITELLALFGQLWTTAGVLWTAGTTALTTLVTTWWTTLTTLWTTSTTAITTLVTTWWTALATLWTTQETAVVTATTTWWTTLTTAWTTGTTAVTTVVTAWWTSLVTGFTTMMAAITKAITDALAPWATLFTTALAAIGKVITDAAATLGQAALDLGKAIVTQLIAGINANIAGIAGALTAGVTAALNAARSLLPSGGGGGGVSPESYRATNEGGFANNQERVNYVAQEASARGHSPVTATRVAMSEGAGPAGPVGDGGRSFGAFQAYTGGGQGNQFQAETGLDPRDPNNEKALIRWQLDHLSGTGWQPFHGAAATGVGQWEGVNTSPRGRQTVVPTTDVMPKIPLGGTGRGPLDWMPGDLEDIGAKLDAIIPVWEQGMETIQTSSAQAGAATEQSFTAIGESVVRNVNVASGSVQTLGGNTFTMLHDALGNTVTIVQDSMGTVVAQYQALGEGVTASVTQTGQRVTTSFHETNGSVLAITTEQNAGIVSQYETTAAQITATAAAQGQSVVASATTQHEGVVEQAGLAAGETLMMAINSSGQLIQIVTDQNGHFVRNYTEMKVGAVTQTTEMNASVLSISRNGAGEMIATISNLNEEVVAKFTAMGEGAQEAYAVIEDVPHPDYGDIIKGLQKVQKQAESTAKALDKIDSKGDSGDSSGKGKSAGKSGTDKQNVKQNEGNEGGAGGERSGSSDARPVADLPVFRDLVASASSTSPADLAAMVGAEVARALQDQPPVIVMDGDTVTRGTRNQNRRYSAAQPANGVGGL